MYIGAHFCNFSKRSKPKQNEKLTPQKIFKEFSHYLPKKRKREKEGGREGGREDLLPLWSALPTAQQLPWQSQGPWASSLPAPLFGICTQPTEAERKPTGEGAGETPHNLNAEKVVSSKLRGHIPLI